jgi:hypothetical protein
MRIHVPYLAIISFVLLTCSNAFAQVGRESKISLRSNPRLASMVEEHQSEDAFNKRFFGKTSIGQRFPFIERFITPGTELDDSLWSLKLVKVMNRKAVFNALNASEAPYSAGNGSFGETDVLLSKEIDIRGSNTQLYISLSYSTGSTWNPGDSLVLELETPSGNYAPLWTSDTALAVSHHEVIPIPIDYDFYSSASINIRVRCYTAALATNTETFLLDWVVMADRIELPYSDNFFTGIPSIDSILFPSNLLWQHAQTNIAEGLSFTPDSRVVVFDSKDTSGVVYDNNGFADTLHSHPINLTLLSNSDSVFLRFYYKAMPASGNNDSLILEFLNNLNVWVRVWQTGSADKTNFVPFIRQVNAGRFRHANFQYRLINKCTYAVTDTMQFVATGFNLARKLLLPFVDDFSNTTLYPSTKLWMDRDVFINNDFAIRPPSFNVATFDGLDDRGNAYGQGSGYLDTLTSVPINLKGLIKTDSTYLSFFIEPQGLGDKPNSDDSLVLEFRTNDMIPDAWQTVWNASVVNYPLNRFSQIYIFIDSIYLHDEFQFRFKNIGSRTGNLHQWHVDYIRLNRGRRPNDGYQDFAITNTPSSLLKKYYSMPRRHYDVNPPAYTNTLQQLGISNNSENAFPMNFGRKIYDPAGTLIDTYNNVLPGLGAASDTSVSLTSTPSLPTAQTGDSLVFKSVYNVNQNFNIDNIVTNDTAIVSTIFSNFFAYDDGTAEAGYGLENEPGAVALGYTLELPDTLQGISVFFNQALVDVSTQQFNIMVWSAVGTQANGQGEIVLKKILQSRPTYINKRNGFYYLQFIEPMVLPAGKFYIGWDQTDVFHLNVGFDQNYFDNGVAVVSQDMYHRFQADGIWQRTRLSGALMMRPIIGKWIDQPVGMKEVEKAKTQFDVTVYPNPASTVLYFNLGSKEGAELELFDLTGKSILKQTVSQNELSLPSLFEGLYLLKVTEPSTGSSVVKKIIIKQ